MAFIAYVAAIVANLLVRVETSKGSGTLIQSILTDEDSQTFINVFMLAFCGKLYFSMFVWTLMIWAFLNICEGGNHLLNVDGVKGLKNFRSMFNWARTNRLWLVKLKNTIEVLIVVSCPFGWIILQQCAPLLPIIYIQIVRVKYVTS